MTGPRRRHPYQQLIHSLNQRYYREWRRAERLERELAAVRGRWFGPVLGWLRYLRRRLLPVREPVTPIPAGSTPVEDAPWTGGRVSVIIPFRDRVELLRGCLRSLDRTCPPGTEVVLVDNDSRERRTRRYLERLGDRVVVVRSPGPFNFSRVCNDGVRAASGEYLLFLNNDTEALEPGWVEAMGRLAARPDVAVAGALLLYPDGTVQHAGIYPDEAGRWVHAGRGELSGNPGWEVSREVPAVTGACLLMRREVFERVGGFDERLPVTYGDVDLCCRARAQGLRVVMTPEARLIHYEGLSRGFSGDEPGSGHLDALAEFPA